MLSLVRSSPSQSQPTSAKIGNPFGARSFWGFKLSFLSGAMVDILQHPRHLFQFILPLLWDSNDRKYPLSKMQLQPTAGIASTRARQARQAVFVFLPSPLHLKGVTHWKQAPCVWRLHLLPKTAYLPFIQQLRCEYNCLHLDGRGGLSAARQKRRRRISLATAARRVKARGENPTPFAFTHNTLCNRWLQRILTRVYAVNPSHATTYKSTDCNQKVKRWRQKNENSLSARNARARGRRGRRSPSPQPLAKSCPLSPPTPPLLRESRLLFTDSKNNRSFSTARSTKKAQKCRLFWSVKRNDYICHIIIALRWKRLRLATSAMRWLIF